MSEFNTIKIVQVPQASGSSVGAVVKVKGSHSSTTVKTENKGNNSGYIKWGANDNYPQDVIKKVKKNGAAGSGLRLLQRAHYGNGLAIYKTSRDQETKKRKVDYYDFDEFPAINSFMRNNRIAIFTQGIIKDLEWFGIAFPEFVLSNDFKEIVSAKRQQASWCRYAMPDDDGNVRKLYISSLFGTKTNIDVDKNEYVSYTTLLSPYMTSDEVLKYCKDNKIHKFVIPIFFPLLDESYYPIPEWHAIITSGWLEVANSVPKFKLGIFNNQVSIKYQIEIDEEHFKKLYEGEWIKFPIDKKLQIRDDLIKALTDNLGGTDNGGKSINSIMYTDSRGQQISTIRITAIDDKLKDGSYLPEAEAANSEVLFALGTDPSLIGAGIPGGKMGSGSGSDKRIAFNLLQSFMKSNRDVTIEIFNFISTYNKWEPGLKFGFENVVLETLDKNPTGVTKAI
ncbi:hypothetical protein HX056_01020 [Myroides odoratimimus]|uniref:hypothetical protein n=1 Tax=Myroides odoratimimus TaxID=76832 RepID=UPI002576BDE3|nr:hypothetical protein [Myroides odoratimimus]MDM1441920.1 hypothetical protein [Myroides odoratimimus]